MTERNIALQEAHQNSDEDSYFDARPQINDSFEQRRIFRAGHKFGFESAQKQSCTSSQSAPEQAGNVKSPVAWISVDDMLPTWGESVALLNINNFENCSFERNIYAAGYLAGPTPIGESNWWSIRGEPALIISAFTHWMPLPTPPKGD